MTIQEHFDQIGVLFHEFDFQRSQIEAMETHFHDMTYNPTKYYGILCPISLHSLVLLRHANARYFAQSIYNELESLYKSMLLDFDATAGSTELYNIRLQKILNKFIHNTTSGALIKVNPVYPNLVDTILNSIMFNSLVSPQYSIINSFIEWRGANAHFTLGSRSIDLTYFKVQFDLYKPMLISSHDKLLRYLLELKSPRFNTDFDSFV